MKLVEIKKDDLDVFVSALKQSQFLQSYEWGEFQKGAGSEVLRFGLDDNGTVFAFSIYLKNLPLGKKYFYSPRIDFSSLNKGQKNFLIDEILKIAKIKKAIFWRLEPVEQLRITNYELRLENYKLRICKTLDVQASKTNILDISRTVEEILKGMHQKTRYNIRLAEKKGVRVRVGTGDDFEKFWEIMNETKDRDGFRLHGKEYYKKMLDIDFIELVLAEFEGKIIAGNIVSCFGDMASYIHGSSSDEHRNVMAPYLIQWQSIQRAKERGCKYYDFNGIDDTKWPGVTRFKRGFGGEDIIYPGAFDLIFSNFYYQTYALLRSLRRVIGKILKI